MKKALVMTAFRLAPALLAALSLLLPKSADAAAEPLLPCNPAGATFLDIGDVVTCPIEQVADSDRFDFEGIVGETIMLTLVDRTSGAPAPFVQLFDPTGTLIDSFFAQEGGVARRYDVVVPGTHVAVVSEFADNELCNYHIALQRVFPAPPDSRDLSYDSVVEDEINPVGDSDVVIFNGDAGQTIRVTLTDRTGGAPAPFLQLFDPNGGFVDSFFAQEGGVSRLYDLTVTGTYAALVTEFADNELDTYSLGLQCVLGPCPTPPIPECEIELSQTSYTTGETVTAQVFRFTNTTTEPVAVEIKVWLGGPGFSPIRLVNAGADGSVVLPPGFDVDAGPLPLFPVTPNWPRGKYELSCRILRPVTGKTTTADLNPFDVVDVP